MASTTTWEGIFPSLPTIFDDSGAVDGDGFRRVVRFALDHGAHGLVCFGVAGEVGRLTVAERERLLEIALDEAAGAVPVLTGATAENLLESQRLARHAQGAGAAGIVMPPPTAYPLGEEHLVEFFAAVANATSLPALIQDAPEYLGVGVRPEAVRRAAEQAPAIRGVKLETSAEGIEAWRAQLGPGFTLYGGNGGLFLLDCLRAGAAGIMPGVDTVDLQVAVYDAERRGDTAEADRLFERLLPLIVFQIQSIEHYNACAKHVLRRRGVDVGPDLRLPGPHRLAGDSVARLEAHLRAAGVPVADAAPLST